MKVVDVCEFYAEFGGGVRTYVHQKLRAARAQGVDMVIVAPGKEDREEVVEGGRLVWVKSPTMPFDSRYHIFANKKAIFHVLDQEAPDVIEGSSTLYGGRCVATYPRTTPRALVFHQDLPAVYGHTFLDQFFDRKRIDRLFAPYWMYARRLNQAYTSTVVAGEWLKERLLQVGFKRVHAIPFGIEKDNFDPSQRSEVVRAELLQRVGLDTNGCLLLAISRHHPEKRVPTMVDAVHRLRRNGHAVGLVVYGDGPLRSMLERRARKGDGVVIAGFAKDRVELAHALASADGFLHGSAAETYGLVVAEAIAAGTPVVAPNVGGALDLASPDYSELYEPGDTVSCMHAIERFLGRDHNLMRECAIAARRSRVRDIRDHFQELFAHYASLKYHN